MKGFPKLTEYGEGAMQDIQASLDRRRELGETEPVTITLTLAEWNRIFALPYRDPVKFSGAEIRCVE